SSPLPKREWAPSHLLHRRDPDPLRSCTALEVARVAMVTSSRLLCKVTISGELFPRRTGITNVLQ
ncbi:hypothetical protein KUDE01_006350, partial [Dissostichus eleginoides]